MKHCIGFVAGLAVIVIIFVTAFEVACYSDFGFYEKEYEKYNVNHKESIVNMSMDELMKVTRQMMAYLHGDREDLDVYAVIDGREKPFFNEIEKSHMEDVRNLFQEGLDKRWIAAMILLVSTLLLTLNCGIREGLVALCNGISRSIWFLLAVMTIIIFAASVNFTAVFYLMHMLLFNNNNWLLDPEISRLINVLPEDFFVDMGIRIGRIFIFLIFFILFLCFLIKRGMIRRNMNKISGGTYE